MTVCLWQSEQAFCRSESPLLTVGARFHFKRPRVTQHVLWLADSQLRSPTVRRYYFKFAYRGDALLPQMYNLQCSENATESISSYAVVHTSITGSAPGGSAPSLLLDSYCQAVYRIPYTTVRRYDGPGCNRLYGDATS